MVAFNKEYITILKALSTNSKTEKYIHYKYPLIWNDIRTMPGGWHQQLYMYIHEMSDIPICPICGAQCKWNKFQKCFYRTCGNKNCNFTSSKLQRYRNKISNISQENIEKYELFKKNETAYKRTQGLYTIWRSKVGTKNAKKIGFDERWITFEGFINNIPAGYKKGYILIRKNLSLPYTMENCLWGPKGSESIHNEIKIEYKDQIMSLKEISTLEGVNYNGLKNRYFNRKKYNYSIQEIVFGRKKIKKQPPRDPHELEIQFIKNKASGMLANYKIRDVKKGLEFDISKDYMIDIMLHGHCHYCGTTKKLGLDRIDNTKGHTMDNVVPCCYECNVVRNNSFTIDEMQLLGKTIRQIRLNRGELL